MSKTKVIIAIVIVAGTAFAFGAWVFMGDYYEADDMAAIPQSCNVLGFAIQGDLLTYTTPATAEELKTDVSSSGNIVLGIHEAAKTPNIKAVLLSVDSGGGDGVAGEEIANALKALEKSSVAVIRSMGASAAYWAATGADKIYASRISDVGGLGVTASYLDETQKNLKEGYTYVELTSAPYKDAGVPSRPLTATEKTTVLSDLKKIHEVFVDAVSENRNLEREKVAQLANGLTVLGSDALENGLIDDIGDLTTATDYISEQIGEKAVLCWY